MPHSDSNGHTEGQDVAVAAEVLFVVNLLLLPFLAFAALLALYIKKHRTAAALARSHLDQTMRASLWAAAIFIVSAGCVMLLLQLGMEEASVWIVAVTAFTIIHASIVMCGVVGLAKAMAGKCWRFPLLGRKLPPGCNDDAIDPHNTP